MKDVETKRKREHFYSYLVDIKHYIIAIMLGAIGAYIVFETEISYAVYLLLSTVVMFIVSVYYAVNFKSDDYRKTLMVFASFITMLIFNMLIVLSVFLWKIFNAEDNQVKEYWKISTVENFVAEQMVDILEKHDIIYESHTYVDQSKLIIHMKPPYVKNRIDIIKSLCKERKIEHVLVKGVYFEFIESENNESMIKLQKKDCDSYENHLTRLLFVS